MYVVTRYQQSIPPNKLLLQQDAGQDALAGDPTAGLPRTGSGAEAVMRSVSSGMHRKGSFLATEPPLSSEAMYSAVPEAAQTTEPGACPAEEPCASGLAASLLVEGDAAAPAVVGDTPGVASCTSAGCVRERLLSGIELRQAECRRSQLD